MKVKSFFNGTELIHKSYSAFYKWSIENNLFATKNGLTHMGCNTSSLVFRQKDGRELELKKCK